MLFMLFMLAVPAAENDRRLRAGGGRVQGEEMVNPASLVVFVYYIRLHKITYYYIILCNIT